MNPSILSKLIAKAEVIDKAEIKEAITSDIEDFYSKEGKLFFVKSENSFYKLSKGNWYKLNTSNKPIQGVQAIDSQNTVEILNWMKKIAEHVEERIRGLEIRQDEMIQALKENFDLKFKMLANGK
jgi:hypothetical protein